MYNVLHKRFFNNSSGLRAIVLLHSSLFLRFCWTRFTLSTKKAKKKPLFFRDLFILQALGAIT